MAVRQWTLTDVSKGVYVDDIKLTHDTVGGTAKGYEITKRTLRGGLCDGVDVIHIDNGHLEIDVLPTRGMGLWKACFDGQDIGWRSPVRGPVHPQFVPLMDPGGLGWLEGFDELLVRCGLESNGAPEFGDDGRLVYPLHGRIANRPAHRVDVSIDDATGEIAVTGTVEETRFHFSKLRLTSTLITRIDEPLLRIRDEVENLSGSPAEVQLLYHINFGEPLLDAGSQFVAPVQTVVPRNDWSAEGIERWDRYAEPQAGFAEQVYFLQLLAGDDGWSRTLLKNAEGTRGFSVHVDTSRLPCFTLWKNTTAAGDGYVSGLEPGTNFPNPRSFEGRQGRVVPLDAGGKVTFALGLEGHKGRDQIAAAEQAIHALQAETRPQVHTQPQADWVDL